MNNDKQYTDTERLDWVLRNCITAKFADEGCVVHSPTTSRWHEGKSPREAIDAEMAREESK